MRDEESESQRKARSRQARQSRRSTQVGSSRHTCRHLGVIQISTFIPDRTADVAAPFHQGVTLTDLQEAEKTIGRSRPAKTWEEEKEKQDKEKQEEKKETETKEEDYRSKYRSFEEVRLGRWSFPHPDVLKRSSSLIHCFPVSRSATGLCPCPPPRLLPALPPPRPTPAPPCPPAP